MKIKRNDIHRDACLTSINLLYERVEKFFERNSELNSTNRFYADHNSSIDINVESDEIIDVIFFGDCFKKFFESGNWIFYKCRFWVLSRSNKNILEEVLLARKDSVHIIPRDELFTRIDGAEIDWSKKLSFVFAGRISAQKNISSMIFFTHHLIGMGVDCSLDLFGEFEDTFHEDYGRRVHENYREEINTLVKELDLVQKINFHDRVDGDTWCEFDLENPVYLSLSNYICEDFGCSIAQAQERGWPVVISDWGGHRDVEGQNIYKIPSSYIVQSHLCRKVVEEFSLFAARYLYKSNPTSFEINSVKVKDDIFQIEDVDSSRRNLIRQIGGAALLLNREFLDHFSDTVKGRGFLNRIRTFMSGRQKHICLIAYDFDDYSQNLSKKIFENLHHNHIEDFNIHFISSKDVFYKDSLNLLLKSQRVYLDSFSKSDEIYEYLVTKLHIEKSIIHHE
jgi:hypothetical protein